MRRRDDRRLVVGLDIGTSKVVAIVGEVSAEGKLEVTRRGQFTRVQCKKCQKFVEGQFGSFE